MSQRGISFRLNSTITTITVLIIASIVLVNYYFANKILIKEIENGAVSQSNLVVSKIARITVGTEEIARNVSDQALYYHKNNDLDFLINQILKSNTILRRIQLGLFEQRTNRFLYFSTDKAGYQKFEADDSLQVRQFMSKIKVNGAHTGLWVNPYFNPVDSQLMVSYKMPVFVPNSNEIIGLVSCEISLDMMQQILSKIKIGANGYAYIVDQQGAIITHPKREWIFKKGILWDPAAPAGNPSTLIRELGKGNSGAFQGISDYLGGQKSWYYFSRLPNSNWFAVIVMADDELFSDINAIFYRIILVSFFGIIFLFLINLLVFKRMLDPLIQVTYAIKRFTSSPQNRVESSRDEIEILADSLEEWQVKYGKLIHDQSKTAREKQKIEKDLKTAQQIQLNIVPSSNPDFAEHPEIDLYAILKPAEIIGGDLYDYFFIGKNHLLFAIGDVSGKGIPASLFMAIASTLIKTNAKILSSKDIVSKVNKELCERNSNQYFVTLFLGILDVRYGILDYCNAAHNFPYILKKDGSLHTLSKSHGLPLGIYSDKEYYNSTIELRDGDSVILYTDGVVNSIDSSNHHYGAEKLEVNIKSLTNLTAEEIVNRLLKSIYIFEGENKQADDISLMAIKYLKK